jgi:ADP-ribose pyrophosphatase YjhB (NUDIX family)
MTIPASLPSLPRTGVGVVILRARGSETEVLLVRRGQAPRKGEWSIPGGRQEFGETVRETAVREVREETGLTVGDLTLIDVIDGFTRDDTGRIIAHWTLVDFCADWVSGDAQAGDDALDVRWVPLSELHGYSLWPETVRVIRDGALSRS